MLNVYTIDPVRMTMIRRTSSADARGVGDYEIVTRVALTEDQLIDHANENWAAPEGRDDWNDLTVEEGEMESFFAGIRNPVFGDGATVVIYSAAETLALNDVLPLFRPKRKSTGLSTVR